MTVDENRRRLDRLESKVVACEATIGAVGGLVGRTTCAERHSAMEGRMARVEHMVDSFNRRLWMILLGQIGLIVGLILLIIELSHR